jgi:dTMP kinase
VLDCTVETGLKRTRARSRSGARDRFEGEQLAFHRRVREGFLTIARAEPGRVMVVDSERGLAAVAADIRRAVDDLFKRRWP